MPFPMGCAVQKWVYNYFRRGGQLSLQFRAGTLLIGFPSASLVFCPKMSEWSIHTKNEWFTHLLIFGEQPEQFVHDRSFPLSGLSESLMVAHFWWATWAIRSHCSFLVGHLSDSLTSLTKKEGMSDLLIFFFKNRIYKTYKKTRF